MSKIDYQALREAAERAIPAMERLLMLPADDDLLSEQELKDYGVDIDALNAFKFLAGPETVLALLDERERNQQYIKRRDQENEMMVDAMHAAIALTSVGIDLDDYDECVLRLHEWGALPDYCIALYVDFVHGIVSKNKLLDFGYINGAPVWTLRDELEAAENNLIDSECHVAELEEALRDKQALLEASEKRIAELETKANQQTRISDKGLTKLIADADKMLGMRSPVIDSEWWTLLRQFLIELQDRRRNSISESGIRAETLNDLIRHIDRNLDIDAMKSPFELSSEIVDYVNRQLHKENS
ncbi:ead/Ea22-like family protein [Escherichia sp. TW09231]|uniref:ead/Ea22-like family protein n=1 Tax=Escherichia sp. TW09231 TaxID=754327 RepID=UPI0002BC2F96